MSSRRELAALSAFDVKDIGYPPRAETEKPSRSGGREIG
jgi:hypothetical protein